MANLIMIYCLRCGANLTDIKPNEVYACPNCGKTHFLEVDQLKESDQQEAEVEESLEVQQETDSKKTKPTIPENPVFTVVSATYLFSFFVATVALLFFVNIDTAVWGFTLASNIYIAICGFGIGVSPAPKEESEISDPTIIAILLWLIYNILLMVLGFPMAILTRLGASFIYFIIGAIIGTVLAGDAISIEVKKVEKLSSDE